MHEFTIVDAFTSRPFSGNPAAVCILPPGEVVQPEWMQQVAAELNLSETVFLAPSDDGSWGIRWFTPTVEVDLCGHATVASAHVLWQSGRIELNEVARFASASGPLEARRDGDLIELDFPARPVEQAEAVAVLEGLGVGSAAYVGSGPLGYLVEVRGERIVRGLRPDFRRLGEIPTHGFIVTSRADEGGAADVVTRCFWPSAGVDEDPVTGSSACALGPHWSKRLGTERFTNIQASKRGGTMRITMRGDRVGIAGEAVTVMTARMPGAPVAGA